ncbi:MAG: AAA family ATPase, partial [Tissierellales bacterium]|nr:AAA family ATPase [Tissierellales bacterium]
MLQQVSKHINKDIQFNKGINVIYGDNETGKSTIHKFIEAVLFGIDSSDDDILKKYQPWFSEDYKGQIELNENDNEYLVFRDFKSNYTSFNDEEVNDDNPNSIKQPGYQLLGVNRDIYRNTLSIGQLNSKTDRELLKEIKNKIENLGKAKDENISVENVLKRLDEKIDNKKYQEAQDRIKELHVEKSNIENNKSNIVNYNNEISKHKEALEELYERKEILNPLTTVDDFDELENKYISSEKIINEINKLSNEIDSMKKNMDIEIEDYEQLILLSSKNEKLEDEQKDLMKNLESLEKEAIYIKNDFQKFKNVDESNFISQYELYKSNKKILERLQTKLDDLTDEIQEINDKNNKGVISSFNELAKEKKRKKYINGILEGNIVDILKEKLKKERNRKWFKIIVSLFILLGVPIGSYL